MKSQAKSTPNWPALIKAKRLELGETQEAFGRRFGVTQVAVFKWEAGLAEAPYAVTWFLAGDKIV